MTENENPESPDPTPSPRKRRSRRRRWLLFGLPVAALAGLFAARAFAHGFRHGCDGDGEMTDEELRERREHMVEFAARYLDATPQQKTRLSALAEEVTPQFVALRLDTSNSAYVIFIPIDASSRELSQPPYPRVNREHHIASGNDVVCAMYYSCAYIASFARESGYGIRFRIDSLDVAWTHLVEPGRWNRIGNARPT